MDLEHYHLLLHQKNQNLHAIISLNIVNLYISLFTSSWNLSNNNFFWISSFSKKFNWSWFLKTESHVSPLSAFVNVIVISFSSNSHSDSLGFVKLVKSSFNIFYYNNLNYHTSKYGFVPANPTFKCPALNWTSNFGKGIPGFKFFFISAKFFFFRQSGVFM